MFFQCLKESVVKALGEGIGFGLERLEFHLNSFPLSNDHIVTDTIFYLDGKVNKFWTFEESLLNSDHCVVVGYHFNSDNENFSNLQYKPELDFKIIEQIAINSEKEVSCFYSFSI